MRAHTFSDRRKSECTHMQTHTEILIKECISMCTRNNPREKYAHTKTRVDSVINGVQ